MLVTSKLHPLGAEPQREPRLPFLLRRRWSLPKNGRSAPRSPAQITWLNAAGPMPRLPLHPPHQIIPLEV